MKVKVGVCPVLQYDIHENESPTFKSLEYLHPQQVKWFKNCMANYWKAQHWLQEEYNRQRNASSNNS